MRTRKALALPDWFVKRLLNVCEGLCQVLGQQERHGFCSCSLETDGQTEWWYDVISTIIKVYAKCFELLSDGAIKTFKNFWVWII